MLHSNVCLFFLPLYRNNSIIKDLAAFKDVEVHTIRGVNPENILAYLRGNSCHLEVLIIHAGTNYLGTKGEWNLYRNFKKGKISETNYNGSIVSMNPLPANGMAETFQNIINIVHSTNQDITILISAIIPRLCDFERRNDTRMIYNRLLQTFNSQCNVFYIPTYRPFLDKNKSPIKEYFMPDGYT